MKYFRMSWDEMLYVRSWANITMLLATIPDYSIDKEEDDGLSPAERIAGTLSKDEPKRKLHPMAQFLGVVKD